MYEVIYRETRQRVADLVADRPPADLGLQVPACPEWTVGDLVAHLASVAAAVSKPTTMPAGVPNSEWTGRQVAQRRDRSVAENLAEWHSYGPQVEDWITALPPNTPPRVVHDVTQHEADLRGALGQGRPPEAAWRPMLDHIGRGWAHRSRFPGTFVLQLGDREWHVGAGEPATSVAVDPYELWRALFGRRSRAQMAAWEWRGDPDPILDILPVFPARADDLIEAAIPIR